MRPLITLIAAAVLVLAPACSPPPARSLAQADLEWPFYGSDEGGQRYSGAAQITPANVRGLKIAWRYSTGDLASKRGAMEHAAFENTPLMVGGRLYVCSPFNEVSALDPGSGRAIWRFDPGVDPTMRYPNEQVCRGVAYWRDPKPALGESCAERIFMATNDRRLIALD